MIVAVCGVHKLRIIVDAVVLRYIGCLTAVTCIVNLQQCYVSLLLGADFHFKGATVRSILPASVEGEEEAT